jgi:hypothetical protein
MDLVVVPAPFLLARDDPRHLEFGYDTLDGALGDADLLGHVAEPDVGLLGQAQQDVQVVAEEGPMAACRGILFAVVHLASGRGLAI